LYFHFIIIILYIISHKSRYGSKVSVHEFSPFEHTDDDGRP
jgi:hypothetical protein